MKYCVQYFIKCDTEGNASNCWNGIQTAIDNVTSHWENINNKNIHNKLFNEFYGVWTVGGMQWMELEHEKTALFNTIKGLLSPPQMAGRTYWSESTHDEGDKQTPCKIEEDYTA